MDEHITFSPITKDSRPDGSKLRELFRKDFDNSRNLYYKEIAKEENGELVNYLYVACPYCGKLNSQPYKSHDDIMTAKFLKKATHCSYCDGRFASESGLLSGYPIKKKKTSSITPGAKQSRKMKEPKRSLLDFVPEQDQIFDLQYLCSVLKGSRYEVDGNIYQTSVSAYEDTSIDGRYFVMFRNHRVMFNFAANRVCYDAFYTKVLFHQNGYTYMIYPRTGRKGWGVWNGLVRTISYTNISGDCYDSETQTTVRAAANVLPYIMARMQGTKKIQPYIESEGYSREAYSLLAQCQLMNKCRILTTKEFAPFVREYGKTYNMLNSYQCCVMGETDPNRIVDRFIKKFRIPATKKIIKAMQKNTALLIRFAAMAKLGFRDEAVYLAEAKAYSYDSSFAKNLYRCADECGFSPMRFSSGKIFKSIIRTIKKCRGEEALYELMNSDFDINQLIHSTFGLLKPRVGAADWYKNPSIYEGSLEDINNRISFLNYSLNHLPNRPITYDGSELALQYSNGSFSAELLKDTYELYDIDKKFGNYAESLDNRAAMKDAVYLIVKDSSGDTVAFVETEDRYKNPGTRSAVSITVTAAKCSYQSKIDDPELISFIREWFEKTGIKPACGDYDWMGYTIEDYWDMSEEQRKSFEYSWYDNGHGSSFICYEDDIDRYERVYGKEAAELYMKTYGVRVGTRAENMAKKMDNACPFA